MKHGLVDTSQQLPESLKKEIVKLKNQLLNDQETKNTLENRAKLKSSSGYNLKSFYNYENPEEIVTHLLAGSVGTLGVFTEIELESIPAPKKTSMFLLFFPSVVASAEDAVEVKRFGASAVEMIDKYGLNVLSDKGIVKVPISSQAVLIVEFDSNLDEAQKLMTEHLKEKSIAFQSVEDAKTQASVWAVRETMLLQIMSTLETSDEKFPAFADDVAVPPERLADYVVAIQGVLEKFGTCAVFFGHAGEGNLHIRPMVRRENWEETIRELADQVFMTTLRFGGTITSEHGNGRNRSLYLRNEWGEKIYGYFKEIKQIFDPANNLNPDVFFTTDDITKNLQL
jgi:FAD/FMN-containing dehydrogenase